MSAIENERCLDSAEYVLGLLPVGERAAFSDHLSECPDCQARVGELAELLPLLALPAPPTLSVPALEPVVAVPTATQRATAGRRRFTSRRPVQWAAGLLTAAAAVLALFTIIRPAGPATAATEIATSASAAEPLVRTFPGLDVASVSVSVSAANTGSSMIVLCSGALDQNASHDAAGGLVSLWVWTRSGDQVEVTAWTDMPGSMTFAGRSSVAPADIAVFELRGRFGESLSRVNA
ncbi:zf-HC2 domain-containing protein [Nakamurella sp. A5-74]|uniref:Zf-HC2 domain-containing protein n=1 Tax=Nakamurella sp. A5-74 TaxID=3158264 RepID=A0AAU8DSA8_9ACTN